MSIWALCMILFIVLIITGVIRVALHVWVSSGSSDTDEDEAEVNEASSHIPSYDMIKRLLPASESVPQLRWEFRVEHLPVSNPYGQLGDSMGRLTLLDLGKDGDDQNLAQRYFNMTSFRPNSTGSVFDGVFAVQSRWAESRGRGGHSAPIPKNEFDDWISYTDALAPGATQVNRLCAIEAHKRLRDDISLWAKQVHKEWSFKINPPEGFIEII